MYSRLLTQSLLVNVIWFWTVNTRTQVGPNYPAGSGWQQVLPLCLVTRASVLQCYVSIKQTASQHRNSRYELPPLNSWSNAIILLSQDKKFKQFFNRPYWCLSFSIPWLFKQISQPWKISVACDRSDVIPYVSHWLGPWPGPRLPLLPSHNTSWLLAIQLVSSVGRQQHRQQVLSVI